MKFKKDNWRVSKITYLELLKEAENLTNKYEGKDFENVKWLMLELSGFSNAEFYANINKEADSKFIKLYKKNLNKYLIKNIPVQHLVGFSYFYGEKFIVNKNVLIPRYETEELVENTVLFSDIYFGKENKIKILDLATGSGCIGITLAKEIKFSDVTASDISSKALKVARKNALKLNADVKFIKSNWFNKLTGKFDIIISNPPYLFNDELIGDTVSVEPKLALYGGNNGLKFYNEILKDIRPFLNDKALVGFEHGVYHNSDLLDLIEKYFPEAKVIQLNDLNGRPRMTFFGIGGVLINE